MSKTRRDYLKRIKKLMEYASIRQLAGLYIFTKAYLGINEEAHGGTGPTKVI